MTSSQAAIRQVMEYSHAKTTIHEIRFCQGSPGEAVVYRLVTPRGIICTNHRVALPVVTCHIIRLTSSDVYSKLCYKDN